jgi:hypothetical protein
MHSVIEILTALSALVCAGSLAMAVRQGLKIDACKAEPPVPPVQKD